MGETLLISNHNRPGDAAELRRTQTELAALQARYLDFYNLSPVGFCSISKQGLIIETNLTTVTLLGASQDALINQPFTRFIHNEDQSIYCLLSKHLFESGGPQTCDLRMLKMDDMVFWAHLAATTVLDKSGAPVCHIVLSDITERKQMERNLRKSERLLGSIFRAAPTGIGVVSNRILLAVNDRVCDMVGYSREEMIGQSARMLYPSDAQFEYVGTEKYRQILQGGTGTVETLWQCKDGRIIDILMSSTPINPMDLAAGVTFTALDITERKKAENALRESEERFRKLFQQHAAVNLIIDPETGNIIDANEAASRFYGWSIEELRRMRIQQINVLSPEAVKAEMEKAATLESARFEFRHQKADGSIRDVEVFSNKIEIVGKGLLYSIVHDITDRKLTEDALRESEEKFRLTFDFSPDSVNIHRLEDGQYVDINEGFIRATGFTREEVIGRTSLEIGIWHDPADQQKLVRGLRENGFYDNLETQFRRKDGSLITALMSARVISLKGVPHIISITRDITERKLVEAKLQQAQKFEAIGTLAGGVAHDFNNLLMGIQGRASLISLDLETSHPHRDHIHAIEGYIRSATNLTKQLLGFARGGKYEIKPVDMNELVLGTSAMFGRTKKEVQIHIKCQPSPVVIEADRGQIEQVLLNMYINAWQAMPPGGGELYLETKIVTMDEVHCKPHQAKPGRYVKVSITDTGAGMDEATRLRIFDPFFTTKEKSRGTGLGLASAYGIIKNHSGMITVYSEIGQGTTFNIYLPVSGKEADQEAPLKGSLIKGSATILLVDDEEMIIEVGQAILERLGYHVIVSRGGREAVETINNMGNEIDLVILDMIMPGMDGSATFDGIREIQPGIPVLLSSGYSMNGQAHEIMRRGCNGFIQKPYNISELSQKIRRVLDGSNGAS